MKILLFFLSFNLLLSASNVYVISNEPIETSKKELQKFFSAKSDYLDGTKYKRVNNKESIQSFANLALSTTKKKLSKRWVKQNFRKGIPFPVSLKNDLQTIEWIKNNPNTVGFITQKNESVNIIYTFEQ